MGGAGAEKNTGKSGAGAEEKWLGSATLVPGKFYKKKNITSGTWSEDRVIIPDLVDLVWEHLLVLPDEGGDEGAGALWGGPVHQLPQLRAAHAGQAAPEPGHHLRLHSCANATSTGSTHRRTRSEKKVVIQSRNGLCVVQFLTP